MVLSPAALSALTLLDAPPRAAPGALPPLPLSRLRPLVKSLRVNERIHAAEVCESAALGYARGVSAEALVPEVSCIAVPRRALGLGPANPFCSDDLLFTSESPIFSDTTCSAIRREAASHIATGARSSFTMIDTNRDVYVHSLPLTQRLLNRALRSTLYPLAARCFPGAVADASELFVYRALVVWYDATSGLTHQPVHRDGSLISMIISLSPPSDFSGGGTWIESIGSSITPPQGHVVMHPSALRHSGGRINRGERWVLVAFIGHERFRFAEHGRRFTARAATAASEGDAREELRLTYDGLQICPDRADLWNDAGSVLHEHGDLTGALEHYKIATRLNPLDPKAYCNQGAALIESNAPVHLAFQAFEHALNLDPYLVPAWRNLCGTFLALGDHPAFTAALSSAPFSVHKDPIIANMNAVIEGKIDAPGELTVHICRSNRDARRVG